MILIIWTLFSLVLDKLWSILSTFLSLFLFTGYHLSYLSQFFKGFEFLITVIFYSFYLLEDFFFFMVLPINLLFRFFFLTNEILIHINIFNIKFLFFISSSNNNSFLFQFPPLFIFLTVFFNIFFQLFLWFFVRSIFDIYFLFFIDQILNEVRFLLGLFFSLLVFTLTGLFFN